MNSPAPPTESLHETRTTCCYCGVGCGVIVQTAPDPESITSNRSRRVIAVRGDPDHPANHGKLCSKGATLHLTADPATQAQTRAHAPELRLRRGEPRRVVDWEQALEHVADRLAEIIARYGPEAVAVYGSGQLLTEDYYVFNKLVKGLLGTNQIDTNSRLCMSSAVAGYKRSLGSDAPPCSYADFDDAAVVFITGANPAFAHPVAFRRLEAARERRPEQKWIVVDPRRTDTAELADLHLQIQPGTDVALHHGLLHIMLWEGWIDPTFIADHTEGFADLKARVKDYPPKTVAELCGIAEADLMLAARWFAQSPATLSLYCQGLNQSAQGTANNTSLINLHLACAQIGRPGAGPFSLTGQPNAMGGREVGGMANLLSGHRDLADPRHRAEVARLWGVPDVPATPGLTAVPLFEAVAAGTVKALWIVCTNPAQSLPDQGLVQRALETAELVIVQEAYAQTATARHADVLLPAASWAEKEGTVTNSERRISRVRAAVPPWRDARPDWAIAADLGRRLERRLPRRASRPLFDYADVESVWNEHRESTRGRDLDITGLSYALLERDGPQQWPMPLGATRGTERLYTDRVFPTPSGRARFVVSDFAPPRERTDARHPFSLNTGRLRDQWHGGSRTGTVARLVAHAPEPVVQIAPRDLHRLGLNEGELVRVRSRRGAQILAVQASDAIAPGQAFVAMHWGREFVSGRDSAGVNTLTLPALDPDSFQPELKHCAVRLERVDLAWQASAFGWFDAREALAIQRACSEHLDEFAYGSCTIFGRENEPGAARAPLGVLLRLADDTAPEAARLEAWLERLQMRDDAPGLRLLTYADARRAQLRRVRLSRDSEGHARLSAAWLSGAAQDVEAQHWLREMLDLGTPVDGLGAALLQPGSKGPAAASPKPVRHVVCNCLDVDRARIEATLSAQEAALAAAQQLSRLQASLHCGTQCGSCLPELKRLIRARSVSRSEVPS